MTHFFFLSFFFFSFFFFCQIMFVVATMFASWNWTVLMLNFPGAFLTGFNIKLVNGGASLLTLNHLPSQNKVFESAVLEFPHLTWLVILPTFLCSTQTSDDSLKRSSDSKSQNPFRTLLSSTANINYLLILIYWQYLTRINYC